MTGNHPPLFRAWINFKIPRFATKALSSENLAQHQLPALVLSISLCLVSVLTYVSSQRPWHNTDLRTIARGSSGPSCSSFSPVVPVNEHRTLVSSSDARSCESGSSMHVLRRQLLSTPATIFQRTDRPIKRQGWLNQQAICAETKHVRCTTVHVQWQRA